MASHAPSDRERVLVGREGPVKRVDHAVASGLATGGAVLLTGPPGIGKSAMLQAAAATLPAGVRVLRGRATQLESSLPFGVAQQILVPVLQDGLDLSAHALACDVLRGRAAGAEEGAAVTSLSWLLLACADRRATLVVVDDAQWADEESLRWLHHVALRTGGARLALLLAARDAGASALVAEVAASIEATGHVERLGPLDVSAVRLLADARLGSTDQETIRALHGASGGVPLLIGDLVGELQRRDPASSEPSAEFIARLAPEDLQRRIARRLDALGPAATALAQAIAILGDQDHGISRAGRLAGLEPGEVTVASGLLMHEGILDREHHPAHPVVLRAIRAAAGPCRCEQLHAGAARLLHQAGAPSPLVALHLSRAAVVGEPWTTRVLLDAATDASRRGALASATVLLRRALEEEAAGGPRREAITQALAGALITQGDPEGATHLLRLADSAPPTEAMGLKLRAVLPLVMSGQAWRVPQVLSAPEVVSRDDPEQRFAVLVLRALAASFGSGERLGPLLQQALSLVDELPAATDGALRRGRFGQLALMLTATDGDAADVGRLAGRSMTPADVHRADAAAGLAVPGAAWAAALAEHDAPADDALQRIEAAARRRGALSIGLVSTLGARACVAAHRGDLARAEADARLALTYAHIAPLRNLEYARLALGTVLVERGAPAEVHTLEFGPPRDIPSAAGALVVARAVLAGGRHAEAMTIIETVRRLLEQTGVDGGPLLAWREVRAEALLALGRRQDAAAVARELQSMGRRAGLPGTEAAGVRLEGLATGSVETLRHAVAISSRSTRRLEHARGLLALGGALRRSGARRDARVPLAEALAIATRSTASVLAASAADELRSTGARPRSALRAGADALTPSERRVADLAAAGRTNREIAALLFVSVKTVESQLRSTFRKLDITSRTELPATLPKD